MVAPITPNEVDSSANPTRSLSAAVPTSTRSSLNAPVGPGVNLVITYAGWNATEKAAEVAAYVSKVLTTPGRCTLTMTMNGTARTSTNNTVPDVTTTQCGTMTIPGSQLTAGSWSAVVTFASAGISGTAAPISIEVTT
jgi:hypothetical protein